MLGTVALPYWFFPFIGLIHYYELEPNISFYTSLFQTVKPKYENRRISVLLYIIIHNLKSAIVNRQSLPG